jgi:hypothetical protein
MEVIMYCPLAVRSPAHTSSTSFALEWGDLLGSTGTASAIATVSP